MTVSTDLIVLKRESVLISLQQLPSFSKLNKQAIFSFTYLEGEGELPLLKLMKLLFKIRAKHLLRLSLALVRL